MRKYFDINSISELNDFFENVYLPHLQNEHSLNLAKKNKAQEKMAKFLGYKNYSTLINVLNIENKNDKKTKLKEFLEQESKFYIQAECHDDLNIKSVEFNALKYFYFKDDKELTKTIRELIQCEWSGDYPTDFIAQYFEMDNDEIYLILNDICSESIGFECSVNDKNVMKWLKTERSCVYNSVIS